MCKGLQTEGKALLRGVRAPGALPLPGGAEGFAQLSWARSLRGAGKFLTLCLWFSISII